MAVPCLGTSEHKNHQAFPWTNEDQKMSNQIQTKPPKKPSSLTGRSAHEVWCQGLSQDACVCPEGRQEEAIL